jgi:hypothetical protein
MIVIKISSFLEGRGHSKMGPLDDNHEKLGPR